MSETSEKKKGEQPDFIGYLKWNPKKKRFEQALWKNPRKYPRGTGKTI